MKQSAGLVFLCTAIALACMLCSTAWGQSIKMAVQPGFGGSCKQSEWVPVAVDLENRGAEVTGEISISVPNMDYRTSTTYKRPVTLGSRARQRLFLYLRGQSLPGAPVVKLRASRGPGIEADAPLAVLSSFDSLIAIVGQERGALSFLSGTLRGATRERYVYTGRGGVMGRSGRSQIRVADMPTDLLPDLAQAYRALDLLVIGDVPASAIRPEVKESLKRWVVAGGTIVVVGGPDWARLKDPFFASLLPVEVTGAAELKGLSALSSAYAPGLTSPVVVTDSRPKPGSLVLLEQAGVPLIVEREVDSGRVLFLAFDPTRSPIREWKGQSALWNHMLIRAEGATPVLRAAFAAVDPYSGYGMGGAEEQLAQGVLNIPAMQTPPFWMVALFLGGYVLLLVPVNYSVLKWRRRRELAWLTTPAIVVAFAFLAYLTGYGMKGGRLLVNQVCLVETQAGSQSAGVTAFAGLFSPARTSYDIRLTGSEGAVAEVDLSRMGHRGRNLSVLVGDGMSMPALAMDMWSMRVFRVDSFTSDLGQGLEANLVLQNGVITGRVVNRMGFPLSKCEVYVGGAHQSLGDIPDGQSAQVALNAGAGQPANVGPSPPGPWQGYPGGPSPHRPDMRETVMQTVARYGQGLLQQGGPVLTGWASKEFAGLDVRGHSPRTTSLSFVIVHLPISPARKGSLVVPYGVSTGAIVEQDGTEVRPYEGSDIHMGDGYVVKEFRLPGAGSSFVADSLQVFCEYRASSARVYGRVRFAPTPSASAAPPVTQAISLRVYNWKTASWDTLKSSSGTVPVPNPAAHVLLPEAVVRVKFVHHPGAGSAGDATLRRLDISLSGHFK